MAAAALWLRSAERSNWISCQNNVMRPAAAALIVSFPILRMAIEGITRRWKSDNWLMFLPPTADKDRGTGRGGARSTVDDHLSADINETNTPQAASYDG